MIVKCLASALTLRSLPTAVGSTDTGRRIIKDQTATVYGTSTDSKWFYVDAPAGRGWASGQYLTEVKVAAPEIHLASPAWPAIPHGLDAIKALYGEPGSPQCHAGRVKLPAPLKVSWSSEKITEFACHKLLEDVFTSVFNQLFSRGLWELVENFGGCYNYRDIKGSTHLSTHCWGISTDLDTEDNALGSTAGEKTMDPGIIAVFRDHGFLWGGDFSGRKDPMHFQRATGY